MDYRTNRKLELQRDLEHLADEEAELEQLAEDLEACSQYKKAEVRLRTRGLSLIEPEDYEEAKKYVDTLLQQTAKATEKRKEKIKSAARGVAGLGIAAIAIVGIMAATRYYFNANERALEALAKYDTPTKINNIEERKEIISQLDEIFEEHAWDKHSDEAARRYLVALERERFPIGKGARILDLVGSNFLVHGEESAIQLEQNSINSIYFFRANNIELERAICYLNLAKTMSHTYSSYNLEFLHAEGYCKE